MNNQGTKCKVPDDDAVSNEIEFRKKNAGSLDGQSPQGSGSTSSRNAPTSLSNIPQYSNVSDPIVKILNVAGDDTAAKTIAGYLSSGSLIKTLLSLFDAPIVKTYDARYYVDMKRTLEREVKTCQALIIWTYCDPDGEGIGFEVIDICEAVNPSVKIYRARFSAITPKSVRQALHDLGEPNKEISYAADVRREIDLRAGVAFTRFQRLRLERQFSARGLGPWANFGICLFPTLGFVVERFHEIEKFEAKPFWAIKVTDNRDGIVMEFKWEKNRSFEEQSCRKSLDNCRETAEASVDKVTCQRKTRMRPLPLNTVELAKHGSDVLNLTSKATMELALMLYHQGIISYPYTDATRFPDDLDLEILVKQQIEHPEWGKFAQQVLEDGLSPRQGTKGDGAHPPIYPTENTVATLQGNEAELYGFIVRRFLACLSKDAEVEETSVILKMSDERFEASGFRITAENYLGVYPYENYKDITIGEYKEGETFVPTVEMVKGETSPPKLLTESDLMSLKEEHRVGTDSTYAGHIDAIKSKNHVRIIDGKYFMPSKLGLGLVAAYNSSGSGEQISKPDLRKNLENDIKLICNGDKDPQEVLRDQLAAYKAILTNVIAQSSSFDRIVAEYMNRRE